jgi:hypothetical protein
MLGLLLLDGIRAQGGVRAILCGHTANELRTVAWVSVEDFARTSLVVFIRPIKGMGSSPACVSTIHAQELVRSVVQNSHSVRVPICTTLTLRSTTGTELS